MKFLSTVILSLLLVNVFGQNSEDSLIRKAFTVYKTGILNDNADDALSVVDSHTVKYYADILNDVKKADSVRINSLSLINKVTVLGIRASATKNEILAMRGTDAFIYAVKKGLVGKNSVMNDTVGEITIDKDFAKAELLDIHEKTGLFFHFYKEDGKWKIDLTALFPISNIVLQRMIEKSGKNENEFLFEILTIMSGKKVTSDIFNPIE